MVISFGDKDTQKILEGFRIKLLFTEIQGVARRKLRMLNNSMDINELMTPQSDRLDKLKDNLKNYYSIRINNQCRITFKWNNGNPFEDTIIECHLKSHMQPLKTFIPEKY